MPLFVAKFKDCEVEVEYQKGALITFGTISAPAFVKDVASMLSKEVYFLKIDESVQPTEEK